MLVLIADMTVATLKLLVERGEKMNFNFGDFGEGSLNQRMNSEINKIIENIHDLNTDPTKARQLIVKITFEADEKRTLINTSTQVQSKLQHHIPDSSTLLTSNEGGVHKVKELKSNAVGQSYFDTEDGTVKSDTGEVILEEHENNNRVIQFKGSGE